ncbi:MAG: hypothetical protein J7559_20310 [Cohnella sp.]|nr:hypothetical protein [Cohnella sp.]
MDKIKFVDAPISKQISELIKGCDHRIAASWAAECAEHVLGCFEQHHPDDLRPRKAIEAGRAWARGELSMTAARAAAFAAHAAARDAGHAAASAAARAAGHAAATAHVIGHAAHAATYAAKAVSNASHPSEAIDNTAAERFWQRQQLVQFPSSRL